MIDSLTDGWGEVLAVLDHSRPILHGDRVRNWPSELMPDLESAGLCHELPHSQSMACTGCTEQPFRDVVITTAANGNLRAILPCPNCGLDEVPLDNLRRWQVDRGLFVAMVANSLPVSGQVREIIAGRLWRIGRLQSGSTICSVWFGYQLSRRDAVDLLASVKSTGRVLLIVPSRLPRVELPDRVVCATLQEVTVWSKGQIEWDQDLLNELLAFEMPDVTSVSRQTSTRRQSRAADIEALTIELKQHLKAARDHAFHTRDTQAVPVLLPRPTQKELARRLGITESRVSRSLNDSEGMQLRFLWDLADDLDQILGYG